MHVMHVLSKQAVVDELGMKPSSQEQEPSKY